AGIGILQEQAAGDLFDDGALRSSTDLDKAQVLFGSEPLARLWSKLRCGDRFDEQLGDLGRGFSIDGAIDADDTAECGDGIAGERLLVSLEDRVAGRSAAVIGVLDDDD